MSLLKLDRLPIEILKRVASCLPCESLFCLMRVNRSLHSIANDDLVFKAIIQNGNGKVMSDFAPVSPLNTSALSTLPNPNWRKFALADSKLRDWIESLSQPTQIYGFDDVKEWLPQLAAVGHPFITEIDLSTLSAGLAQMLALEISLPRKMMVKFIMTTALLQRKDLDELEDITRVRSNLFVPSESLRLVFQFPVFGSFAWAILNKLPEFRHQILPPSAKTIPLWSLTGLPPPFSTEPATTSAAETALGILVSPAFLEDGEWVGYYTISMDGSMDGNTPSEIPVVDAPMHGINFTATPNPHGSVVLQSDGVDDVGQFTLRGLVYSDGSVTMTKSYLAGFSWEWYGSIGPFGFEGEWGHTRWGINEADIGHFWLWKRAWCRANTEGSVNVR